MLVNSEYIKYDMTEQEYYINKDCILNYTGYSDDDLGLKGIDKQVLKDISHSVYRLIYAQRRKEGKFTHKKYMRKKIYDNEQEEVSVLRRAMIEATKGAIESGMDLNAYIDDPKDTFTHTVYEELRQADLLDPSNKMDYQLDITYTEADETIAT